MKEVQLQFDFELSPILSTEYYREGAQDLLRRILPMDLKRSEFEDSLPLISRSDLSNTKCTK
jgi:hypothetical protein